MAAEAPNHEIFHALIAAAVCSFAVVARAIVALSV